MIDCYAPPDIPKPVIEYVCSLETLPNRYRHIKYLTIWNNKEIYITYSGEKDKKNNIHYWGYPTSLIYDCKNVRLSTQEERFEIHRFMNKYYVYIPEQAHICQIK